MTPPAEQAKAERGRKWDRERERCDSCVHWTARESEFKGWKLCDQHNQFVHADGGCALHLPKAGI